MAGQTSAPPSYVLDSNVVVSGGDGPGCMGPNMGIVAASAVAVAANVALVRIAPRREEAH